jgi:hypothetical protein
MAPPPTICSVCGAAIDTREPRQLLAHLHGAEIQIGVGRPFTPKSASHRGVCQCEALGASLDESFESSGREAPQLRSLIEDLKQGVVKFERQADPKKCGYPIAARTMKARRDNLVRTILTLEEWSKAAPNVEIKLTEDPKHQTPYRNGVLQ